MKVFGFRRKRLFLLTIAIVLLIYIFLSVKSNSRDNIFEPASNVDYDMFSQGSLKHPKGQILCNTSIQLTKFGLKFSETNRQIFFVESYGNPVYRGRQLCSIESALRRSKMNVKVVTLSPILDIKSGALCSLIEEFYPEKLQFFTTTMEELFRSLPVEEVIPRLERKVSRIRFTNTHKSDMIRYALLYKFGGFTLDLDVLVLKELTQFKNSIGMEAYANASEKCELRQSVQKSRDLNGGMMHFEAGSPYLWEAMVECNRTYKPGLRWIALSPPLLYRTALTILNLPKNQPAHNIQTDTLTILPSFVFLNVLPHIGMRNVFGLNVDPSFFQEYFRCSALVHLCGDRSKNARVTGNPRADVYSYLGPTVCPTAFSYLNTF